MVRRISLGVLIALVMAGCKDPDSDESGAVPSFAAQWKLMSVGDPVPGGPPVGTFQDAYDGWTYFFTQEADPKYLCQHDDPQVLTKLDEGSMPHVLECQLYSPPNQPLDGNAPGALAPPIGYSDWQGTETGGCGAWATMMCNRRLGITDPTTPPTQAEYDAAAFGIGQKENGGSDTIGLMAYYRAKGYCIGYESFKGSPTDYAFISAIHNAGCDVKLTFARREGPGENGKERYSNSHIETVIEVGADSMTTNSWGSAGIVRGGSAGGFSHSEDGARFSDTQEREGPKWPPGSTEVFLMAVCPCDNPSFEVLGGKIGK